MDNDQAETNATAPTTRHMNGKHDTPKRFGNRAKLTKKVAGIAIALLAVGGIMFGAWSLYRSSTAANIDASKYQAVFLTNGQVYFGKLQNLNGSYMKLTDIFYLQAKSDADSNNPQETTDQQSADVELIKLGAEVHGPDDEMIVSKDQILFFENLKKDGKVSDTITNFLTNKQ